MRKLNLALVALLLFAAPVWGQIGIPVTPSGGGGGSGTVTQIDTSCGVSGGPITTTGTVQGAAVIRAHTGTSDTILAADCGKVVTASNAGAVAVTLPQATGAFAAPFFFTQVNLGAGTVTITPTTSTINGAATLVLTTGQSADIASDGTNYIAALGRGGAPTTNASDLTSGTLAAARVGPGGGSPQSYVVNNWYNAGAERGLILASSSSAAGATNRTICYPSYFYGTATISTLGYRINTTVAGNIQAAIYANNPTTMRPTGSPLVSTASISMASGGSFNAAASVQITGNQILWWCSNQDNNTGTANGFTNASVGITNIMGASTQAGALAGTAASFTTVTTTQTFGTWGDLTAASFTEQAALTVPIVQFRIGSVP